ncbi:uncharacterized protein LOC116253928 isoform X4 [Nymphaea colorata]|uniref:uncharacterized protein LOC116253928 isoform X4 n=1 Tax=Nymphaea colorata TaxID=210225 RepID=UPI00214E6C16|nr:uncharacterized protein LOC116253928 isoform X4 [Nymphaea colorata]XP_049933788.1 uncharacterized protein LOC116253928 isoform X4 [Nymphaea colorata]
MVSVNRLNSSDIHIAGAASEIDASGCLVSIYGLVKQVEHIDFWTELCLFVHFQDTRITIMIVGGIQVVPNGPHSHLPTGKFDTLWTLQP